MEQVKPICASTECREIIYTTAIAQHSAPDDLKPDERKSVQLRTPTQLLLCLTLEESDMYIHYYCPERLKWMKWPQGLKYRKYPGLAVMEDELFLVGGQQLDGTALNTVVCINLKTLKFTEINPMTEHRISCRAAVLNGFLYVVGGENKYDIFGSVEKWCPKTNTWSKVPSMLVNRCAFGLVVLNEKLYAVGGVTCGGDDVNSAECYDPHRNVWMPIASMRDARIHFGVTVSHGLLYAVGDWGSIRTVERYNPVTNSWTMLCSLNENVWDLESCTTFRNKVVVCYQDRFQEYDDESDMWKSSAYLGVLRNNHRMFTYSGELLTPEFVEI